MVKTVVPRHRISAATNDRTSRVEGSAATICDEHGAALYALASAMVQRSALAQTAVVDVICAAFPATAMAVPMPLADMRRELARRIYLTCESLGPDHVDRERTALALTQHGRLSYRAVADLFGLRADEVATLLKSALLRVSSSQQKLVSGL